MTTHKVPLESLIDDFGNPARVREVIEALRKVAEGMPGVRLNRVDDEIKATQQPVSLVKARELAARSRPVATRWVPGQRFYCAENVQDLARFTYLNPRECPVSVTQLMTKVLVDRAGLDAHCHLAEVEALAAANDGHTLSAHLMAAVRELTLEDQEPTLERLLDELNDIRAAYKSTL